MKLYKLIPAFLVIFSSCLIAQNETETLLKKLSDGNKRFVSSNMQHGNQSQERIKELNTGQNPFAVIVSCSDSRVPPEIIFDQGLGDLFVIRTAGHVVDDIALASIEYAVEHLGVKLVVVLGHEKCGAVNAAVQGGELHGHLGELVGAINQAVESARNQSGDLLNNAIHNNVVDVISQLNSKSHIVSEILKEGHLIISGAIYKLSNGEVVFLN